MFHLDAWPAGSSWFSRLSLKVKVIVKVHAVAGHRMKSVLSRLQIHVKTVFSDRLIPRVNYYLVICQVVSVELIEATFSEGILIFFGRLLQLVLLLRPPQGSGVLWWACLCVHVSVCLSVRDHIFGTTRPIFTNFLCMLRMVVARSTSNSVVMCYVFLVL